MSSLLDVNWNFSHVTTCFFFNFLTTLSFNTGVTCNFERFLDSSLLPSWSADPGTVSEELSKVLAFVNASRQKCCTLEYIAKQFACHFTVPFFPCSVSQIAQCWAQLHQITPVKPVSLYVVERSSSSVVWYSPVFGAFPSSTVTVRLALVVLQAVFCCFVLVVLLTHI